MAIEFTSKERPVFVKELGERQFAVFTSKADAKTFNYMVLGSRSAINLWLCKN